MSLFLCAIFNFFVRDCVFCICWFCDAQNQQTQKMQNLTERNENGAQKKARFYFLLLIFLKNKIYEGLF